jgi:hypothetical protein
VAERGVIEPDKLAMEAPLKSTSYSVVTGFLTFSSIVTEVSTVPVASMKINVPELEELLYYAGLASPCPFPGANPNGRVMLKDPETMERPDVCAWAGMTPTFTRGFTHLSGRKAEAATAPPVATRIFRN